MWQTGAVLPADPALANDPPAEVAPSPRVDASVAHPPDPFPDATRLEPDGSAAREVGIAAGQVRALGLVGIGYQRDAHLGAAGVLELVTFPFLGVRGSGSFSMPTGLTDPSILALRTGPALHLRPYRTVDFGAYVEGGAAVGDLFRTRREPFVTLVPGVTLDVAVGSYWFFHVEAQLQLATLAERERPERLALPMLFLGFGPAL